MATVGSLDEFIEKARIDCSNMDAAFPAANALSDDDLELRSDKETDHQLILKVEFRQPVKLSHIRVLAPANAEEDESAPTTVKVFQGKPNIGFQEAEDEPSSQDLSLQTNDTVGGEKVALKFVKFQSVQNVQIFVSENLGGPVTRIKRVEFFGQPAAAMDMKDWKPVKG
mmetsp:Transcript_22740/g.53059  ORF Transcript_22740/g.53059 Transcript_22740/m.53059 type:complete len:169 (-) Transcript_22740:229-735(-)|eukprot:CAMPEP_0178459562 /NCGR_PEP_ID=MMETSP0689_2-20121128/48199_1 /TAXON_ID=160604 /ORGANISM="Amphidinium massartii, Strain CS-259" /LENGTH=168 /DNA_ID=CAMNT_0020086053 /DNA_START=105 /DNA_END=611 /DNA_ORIENTATION=+